MRPGYQPVGYCPAADCAEGKRTRDLVRLGPSHVIPMGVFLRHHEALYRCPACGLIWVQRASDPCGVLRRQESRAVGHQKRGRGFEDVKTSESVRFDAQHYLTRE